MAFTEIFGGTVIYPSQTSYLPLTMAVDVELAWPIEQQVSGNIVADIIDVNATAPGLTVTIPDARQVSTGFTSLFNNVGAQTVTIVSATGATIVSLTSGTAWEIYLTDNSTESGTWRTFQYGASVSVADAAALAGAGLKAILTTLNQSMPVSSKSVNYVIVEADRAKAVVWTAGAGAFTLPSAATVGADWFVICKNLGSGDLTVTPPSGTIDGAASLTLAAGASAFIDCDGTNYFTVGLGGSTSGSSFGFIEIDVTGSGDYVLAGAELNQIGYRFIGVLSGTRSIVVPSAVQQYWVNNETTGAFSLFIKTASQSPGIEILQGDSNILYCDGTDVVSAESSTVSFPIAINQGGTGAITAGAARTNLGATTVGSNLFTAVSAAAALSVVGGAAAATTLTAGLGLTGGGDLSANRAFAVAMLGIQNLVDPNADRILFWDDSAGATDWLTAGTGLAIAGTTISADVASGSYLGSFTGFTSTPTATVNWWRSGNFVTVAIDTFQATSNLTSFTENSGNMPVSIRPGQNTETSSFSALDSGTTTGAVALVGTGGDLTFRRTTGTSLWTAAGSKGVGAISTGAPVTMSFLINTV